MTPTKLNNVPFFLKEPGGMVVVKVPTWSVTGSVTGLIAGALLLKVKLDWRMKVSVLGRRPKWIWSWALKARKVTPCCGGGMMRTPLGEGPTMTVGPTMLVAVLITGTV